VNNDKAIEEFAKVFIERVRDRSIRNADRNLKPGAGGPVAARWEKLDTQTALTVIPDVVDEVIFCLLNAIDDGTLGLALLPRADGASEVLDLAEAGSGELAGWYAGTGGWMTFSKERYVDDFAHYAVPTTPSNKPVRG
jgi:hypothetical protein